MNGQHKPTPPPAEMNVFKDNILSGGPPKEVKTVPEAPAKVKSSDPPEVPKVPKVKVDDDDSSSDGSDGSKSTLPPIPDVKKQPPNPKYMHHGAIGNGSFGTVYLATNTENGEQVAIKRVFQDKRYKNRELRIMRKIRHPNVVKMLDHYFTESRTKIKKPEAAGTTFLHLVMEYIPENLCEVIRSYNLTKSGVPLMDIKSYAYQICRGVGYIHRKGICHRDIKPQNMLVDRTTGACKLCDFGSAKRIEKGYRNIAYISSRYYRAPELILGNQNYNHQIDVWSTGCSIAEIMLGQALFQGATTLDQLVEISKVLGRPSPKQIFAMTESKKTDNDVFPLVKPRPMETIFHADTPDEGVDVFSRMLVYNPAKRLMPFEALAHPFFDDLRTKEYADLKGHPPINNWTESELEQIEELKLGSILIPGRSTSNSPKNRRVTFRRSEESADDTKEDA